MVRQYPGRVCGFFFLLPLWEKVARTKSVPDEGSASAETDPSPAFASLGHPLPQGERGSLVARVEPGHDESFFNWPPHVAIADATNSHRFKFQTAATLNVIASEAKQSMKPQRKSGLLRRFAPRNDGKHSFAISLHVLPEVCLRCPPPSISECARQ